MSDHDVLREFEKTELRELADDLDLDISAKERATNILKAIRQDLLENGLPDEGDMSDMMEDFLYVAGYVDEDGNDLDTLPMSVNDELGSTVVEFDGFTKDHITTITDTGDGVIKLENAFIIEGEEVQKPPCYAFADERDPACRRCKVLEYCKQERVKSRPECFGKLYSAPDENCSVCLEAINCKAILEAKERK